MTFCNFHLWGESRISSMLIGHWLTITCLQVGNGIRARAEVGFGTSPSASWALTDPSAACVTHLGACTEGGTVAFWTILHEKARISSQSAFTATDLRLSLGPDDVHQEMIRLVWSSMFSGVLISKSISFLVIFLTLLNGVIMYLTQSSIISLSKPFSKPYRIELYKLLNAPNISDC